MQVHSRNSWLAPAFWMRLPVFFSRHWYVWKDSVCFAKLWAAETTGHAPSRRRCAARLKALWLLLLQADKRAHHNALERKRRDHIKDSFHSLRDSVPALQGEKVSLAPRPWLCSPKGWVCFSFLFFFWGLFILIREDESGSHYEEI